MIIKSHIRGGYRAAADYLKDQGLNEKTRVVEISDPEARNLDEAFHNMWVVSSNTRATKPLHHISINPMKDERLTDKQVLAIVDRCEQKYGYKQFHHQRVIIEHVKDGRQHFHVMWNRVSLMTGTTVWPGQHWNKSKQVCREMEKELGLKRPMPRKFKRALNHLIRTGRIVRSGGRYFVCRPPNKGLPARGNLVRSARPLSARRFAAPPLRPARFSPLHPSIKRRKRRKGDQNIPDSEKMPFRRPEWDTAELLAWAWETGRADVLAQFGINFLTLEE